MKARLTVNGIDRPYPDKISDLEMLLLFVKATADSEEEIISEVKVGGARFSETYEHQARKINLEGIEHVEINSQTKGAMANGFLKLAPDLMDGLEDAFVSTAGLLRSPDQEENDYDMLARCLETFYALKSHLESVWNVLEKKDKLDELRILWEKFDALADTIITNQQRKNTMAIAGLLEDRMLPFLKEWKKATELKDDNTHLGTAIQAMQDDISFEEVASRR